MSISITGGVRFHFQGYKSPVLTPSLDFTRGLRIRRGKLLEISDSKWLFLTLLRVMYSIPITRVILE